MTLFPPSPEQRAILTHLQDGSHVVVDAIAGSGKSTTILAIARAMPTKRILQMTYNAMLRKEFRQKLEEHGITNVEVHTYHSLAVKYFSPHAYTDLGMRRMLAATHTDQAPSPLARGPRPSYDMIVMDECQDMTPLYYRFMYRVLAEFSPLSDPCFFQLLLLGDTRQCLYEFKGADVRFLTMAHHLWRPHPKVAPHPFVACSLHTSYRITRPMGLFLNDVMLGETRMIACRDGEPVVYLRNTRSNLEKIVTYHVHKILREGDLASDIFILGPSVKGPSSNIRRLENVLSESGIPCHVAMADDEKLDEKVIDGKVVFSTFHTVKGRQRKYVFVLGFDQSYFTYMAKTLDPTRCPNTLYVACTRATHKMWLLEMAEHGTDRPLAFLQKTHHEMKLLPYVDFKGFPQSKCWEVPPKTDADTLDTRPTITQITVSELLRFVPEEVLDRISPWVQEIFVAQHAQEKEQEPWRKGFTEEEIPSVIPCQNGLFEDVSALNGIAIPCAFYDTMSRRRCAPHGASRHSHVLYDLIQASLQDMKHHEHHFLKRIVKDMSPTCQTMAEYLYMSNVYLSCQERLYFKLKHIAPQEYTWLSEDVLARCCTLLEHVMGETETLREEQTIVSYQMETEHAVLDAVLEQAFLDESHHHMSNHIKYRFKARVDLITDHAVWELKCTHALTMDHMLQLVIYAWIWQHVYPQDPKRFFLFNIKTAEQYELVASSPEILTKIVAALLVGKYGQPKVLTDAEFVAACS